MLARASLRGRPAGYSAGSPSAGSFCITAPTTPPESDSGTSLHLRGLPSCTSLPGDCVGARRETALRWPLQENGRESGPGAGRGDRVQPGCFSARGAPAPPSPY